MRSRDSSADRMARVPRAPESESAGGFPMRSILFAGFAAGALLGPTAVEAQQPTTQPPPPTGPVSNLLSTITNMPPGWTRNLDGTYRQSEAGVLCPKTFKSF